MHAIEQLLRRLGIATRLNVAFTVVLFLTLVVGGAGTSSLYSVAAKLHKVAVVDQDRLSALLDTRNGVARVDLAATKDSLTDDEADSKYYRDQAEKYHQTIAASIQKAVAMEDDVRLRDQLEQLNQIVQTLLVSYRKAMEQASQNKNADAQKTLMSESEPMRRRFVDQVDSLIGARTGIVKQETAAAETAAHAAIVALLITTALALLLGAALSVLIGRSVRGPLRRALEASKAVARGDLELSMKDAGTDEAGQVLVSMGQMANVLKHFSDSLGEIARRQQEGEISYRIAANDFPGAYGRIAADINALVGAGNSLTMRLVEVTGRYAEGDLSVDMDRLPKEKAVISDTMDTAKRNLLAVNAEIKHLVGAASRGDFSQRGDVSRFQNEFLSMIEGLNRLMDVSEQGLRDAARVFAALAEGDITQQIINESDGLFAELRVAANRTTENLESMVGQIKSATDLVNTAAREIAAGNSNLSARTEQQAANLEETASSMEELTGNVKQSADNARMANQLAVGARDTATRGGATVEGVVSTMGQIDEASRRISEIITVIDGIAFQTNILALNAAVEAARAGEQGRGFAVVATEVRSLAQRSAQAAKEIKDLITDAVDKVSSGVQLVEQAGSTMREIVSSVTRVTDVAGEISGATHEQSSGIEQINKAITQMDEMTQQNAALVEEASAAARSLEEQAAALARSVALFRTRQSAAPVQKLERTAAAARVVSMPKPARAAPAGGAPGAWSEF